MGHDSDSGDPNYVSGETRAGKLAGAEDLTKNDPPESTRGGVLEVPPRRADQCAAYWWTNHCPETRAASTSLLSTPSHHLASLESKIYTKDNVAYLIEISGISCHITVRISTNKNALV